MPDLSSERVYRWLLFVYPREHRRVYGELMVQLFLDRMRCEGRGFRGPILWMQMILDLVGAAFEEGKAGVGNGKRVWVGAALGLIVLASVAGVSTLLSQPEIEVKVAVSEARALSMTEKYGVVAATRQAVEENRLSQDMADKIVRSFEGHDPVDMHRHRVHGVGVAGAMGQAVEEGLVPYEVAEEAVRAVNESLGEAAVHLSAEVLVLEVLALEEAADSQ